MLLALLLLLFFKTGVSGLNLAVHVSGKLKSSKKFWEASVANARNSLLEPGVARFDILEKIENPSEFLLMEVYSNDEAPSDHKETAHYASWRDAVADDMAEHMAEPRSARKFRTLYPPKSHWTKPLKIIDEKKGDLLVVLVDIEVLEGSEDAFIEATLKNCLSSAREVGVARFDLLQDEKERTKFTLVEAYRNDKAPVKHKDTKHYELWAKSVESLMAAPRKSTKYRAVFPASRYWDQTDLERNQQFPSKSDSPFTFVAPKKIEVGRGIAKIAIPKALEHQKNPFLVTGKSGIERHSETLGSDLMDMLSKCPSYKVSGEPTVRNAEEATALCIDEKCDIVIAIGGGSAVDLGKAVAAFATNLVNEKTPYSYLEGVGDAEPLLHEPLPFVAVPTTSGTGSEATKNAVLKCEKKKRKASMRSDSMLPTVSIVDPYFTFKTCPPSVSAHVGLDALCQLVEPFVSRFANPLVDALARDGIIRSARSLRSIVLDQESIEAREDMAIASLYGGLALANAKLGAVHGFASVLGGIYDQSPHGAICAALLAPVFRVNVKHLEDRIASEDDPSLQLKLGRFTEVAALLTGNEDATATDAADWLEILVDDLKVPSLRILCDMGEHVDDATVNTIVEATAKASSTKGNPVDLSHAELETALRAAL